MIQFTTSTPDCKQALDVFNELLRRKKIKQKKETLHFLKFRTASHTHKYVSSSEPHTFQNIHRKSRYLGQQQPNAMATLLGIGSNSSNSKSVGLYRTYYQASEYRRNILLVPDALYFLVL